MTNDKNETGIQPTLFDARVETVDAEKILLFALGDFQSRGKVLAGRELPLDRLRGAFKRAAERFELAEFSDEKIAETLEKLGANVRRVPSFVAKHPFKVTVNEKLAENAFEVYRKTLEND